MSHVNTTPHYGLPIYGENDIINPLTDFNDANSAIDTALYNVADAQGSEATAISDINTFLGDKELETVAQNVTDAVNEVNTAVGNADTAIGNVAGDVVTLQTAVGNSSTGLIHDVSELQTTVGSQGNSISALQTTVGDAESGLVKGVADNASAINAINTEIGSEPLDTTAQTLTGAINEMNGKLYHSVASVTSDGVKTYEQLLNELATALASHSSEITGETVLIAGDSSEYGIYQLSYNGPSAGLLFSQAYILDSKLDVNNFTVKSNSSSFTRARIDGNGTTISNLGRGVAVSGYKIEVKSVI